MPQAHELTFDLARCILPELLQLFGVFPHTCMWMHQFHREAASALGNTGVPISDEGIRELIPKQSGFGVVVGGMNQFNVVVGET